MLAEKETQSCLQCLAKVDDLIFKKTGEQMPQPAAALAGQKRTLSSHHMDGMVNGAGPPKRQTLSVDISHEAGLATPLARPPPQVPVTKTTKVISAERQVMLSCVVYLSTLYI